MPAERGDQAAILIFILLQTSAVLKSKMQQKKLAGLQSLSGQKTMTSKSIIFLLKFILKLLTKTHQKQPAGGA